MSAECWSCGVAQEPRRPIRSDFASEPEWLTACAVWLDFTFPARVQQRERIREWDRLALEADPVALRGRIADLLFADDLTPEDDVELDRLIAAWKTLRHESRPTRKATS
ncbi:hypothetical protein [Microbacterium sp. PAMC21962]|uniref:hypothetical protein n=1 Tax=Microbacterium sp. PAMC21962 TaxID=2861280 RepID=UPI001C631B55|nr:hypothetical protein [Microbacterium sp. PAMC21962]QYF98274.1 hypothetical protein KY498_03240 [Microbacterium sp. PAMC21962]